MSIRVEDLKPQFSSIVHADKSALLDADTLARCRELLERRAVLVFPRINLSTRIFHRIAGDEAVN
jgi:hypothetical protein